MGDLFQRSLERFAVCPGGRDAFIERPLAFGEQAVAPALGGPEAALLPDAVPRHVSQRAANRVYVGGTEEFTDELPLPAQRPMGANAACRFDCVTQSLVERQAVPFRGREFD